MERQKETKEKKVKKPMCPEVRKPRSSWIKALLL